MQYSFNFLEYKYLCADSLPTLLHPHLQNSYT